MEGETPEHGLDDALQALRDNPWFRIVLDECAIQARETVRELATCPADHRDGFAKQLEFQLSQYLTLAGRELFER